MNLTGKAKQDFNKWYKIEFEKRNLPYIQGFDISDLSIKYGVYVDFFDSVKYYITINPFFEIGVLLCYDWNVNPDGEVFEGHCETRQEAREQAIIKANEIYNKQNE